MARFYFDLHECGERTLDEDGVDADNVTAAQALAIAAARDIMCGEIKEGSLCLSCHIEIFDGSRQSVGVIKFREAISISGLYLLTESRGRSPIPADRNQ